MRSRFLTVQARCLAPIAAVVLFGNGPATAETLLLRDDFADSGKVNTSVWRLPFEEEGRTVGRTQFRNDFALDVPLQGIDEPLASDGKVLELHLDTFYGGDPGGQFLGTDLLTKRNFARGGGVSIEGRLRLKPTTTGGLVTASFCFDVQRDAPPGSGNLLRDEIDFELLSNEVATSQRPFTNYWDEGPFSGDDSDGDGQFTQPLGIDLTQFQDYRVEWTPQSVKWYVNGTLVRTITDDVPDDPMQLHLNLWAPDSGFAEAYDASLVPAATSGESQRFTV